MPLELKETNISNEHNRLKNPNWREADQLAIYKHDRGVELGGHRETTPAKWSERDLNPWLPDFKSGALSTRPRCLRISTTFTKPSQCVEVLDNADLQSLKKSVVVIYNRSSADKSVNNARLNLFARKQRLYDAIPPVCPQATFKACCLPRRNCLGSSHSPSTCHKTSSWLGME